MRRGIMAAAPPRISTTADEISPAPPNSIARAVRCFGASYPLPVPQRHVRAAAVFLVAATLFYVPWMWTSLNHDAPWLSWPFVVTNTFSVFYSLIVVSNQWRREAPPPRMLAEGAEPLVAVIIPTCNEPVEMVLRTVESIYEQEYPNDRIVIVVSDDGHDPVLRKRLHDLFLMVEYHEPPDRWAPGRDGAAKAGNLNSAIEFIDANFPGVEFVETRDADDEVGYKQRGTWALDTVRLMVWGNLRGLNFRQRRHFYGMLLDYLHGIAVMIYLPCLLMSLLGSTPFVASGWSYVLHIAPVVLATELWLLATNRPYNDRRGLQWIGLSIWRRSASSAPVDLPAARERPHFARVPTR